MDKTKQKAFVWYEQRDSTSAALDRMRKSRLLTDVVLESEGVEFPAHRAHLSAASPFFLSLFKKGSAGDRVPLQYVTPKGLEVVLDFVYSGKLPNFEASMELMSPTIRAAEVLQVKTLLTYCLHLCRYELNLNQMLPLWDMADETDNQPLLSGIPRFLAVNFGRASLHPSFLRLTLPRLKLILTQPDMREYPKLALVQGIFGWIQFRKEERHHELKRLLALVGLEDATRSTLTGDAANSSRVYMAKPHHADGGSSSPLQQHSWPRMVCFSFKDSKHWLTVFDIRSRRFLPPKHKPCVGTDDTVVGSHNDVIIFHSYSRGSSKFYKYSLSDNKAFAMGVLPTRLCSPKGAILNGLLYVLGEDMDHADLRQYPNAKSVYRFSLETAEYDELAEMSDDYHSLVLCPFNDHLYAVGSQIQRYDTLTNQWTDVARVPRNAAWTCGTAFDETIILQDGHRLLVYNLLSKEWLVDEQCKRRRVQSDSSDEENNKKEGDSSPSSDKKKKTLPQNRIVEDGGATNAAAAAMAPMKDDDGGYWEGRGGGQMVEPQPMTHLYGVQVTDDDTPLLFGWRCGEDFFHAFDIDSGTWQKVGGTVNVGPFMEVIAMGLNNNMNVVVAVV